MDSDQTFSQHFLIAAELDDLRYRLYVEEGRSNDLRSPVKAQLIALREAGKLRSRVEELEAQLDELEAPVS